jgi:hypothetical protein
MAWNHIIASWSAEAVGSVKAVALVLPTFKSIDPTVKAMFALVVAFLAGAGSMGAVDRVMGLPAKVEDIELDIAELRSDQRQLERAHQGSVEDVSTQLETVICILDAQAEAIENDVSLREATNRCRPDFPWRRP